MVFSDTLNFTRAAEDLHISQPALHVKIAKLADYLGRPLYCKVGRNLALTSEGVRLQAYARERAEHEQSFVQELRTGLASQAVCLCAGEGAYLYLLGSGIAAFVDTGSKLAIKTGDKNEVIRSILSGEAHLGVTSLDAIPDGLVAEKLTQVGQVLVMPRSHPLARKRTVKLADLNQTKLVVPPAQQPHRVLIDRLLMNADVNWEPAIEVRGWELMLKFVGLGLGLAIVNAYCDIPGNLVARPIKDFPKIQFHVVSRSSRLVHQGANQLRSLIFEHKGGWRKRHL